MPRLCFVIMPFSDTASCTEDEWTVIFTDLFKPAVEDAGLGYECRRSEAQRGNLISAIVRSLREAHVVLADLTDQNPNVFYELGVRHALQNRTILVAQNRGNIPFDLHPYANHVYEWRTDTGKVAFRQRIRELLDDVDADPERPDNPVSDFLQNPRVERVAGDDRELLEESQAERLDDAASPGAERQGEAFLSASFPVASSQARDISTARDILRLREVLRGTRSYCRSRWPLIMEQLDAEHPQDQTQIVNERALEYALPYIERFEADLPNIEHLGLTTIEADWSESVSFFLPMVGDWLTLSERDKRSRYRAIQGTPALLSLRFMCLLGAKAAVNDSFEIVGALLRSGIDSIELGGTLNRLPLVDRRDMLHPDAVLGLADIATTYLVALFSRQAHVRCLFVDERDYHSGLAKFLFYWWVASDIAEKHQGYPLYPAFKLVPEAQPSLTSVTARLAAETDFLEALSSVFGDTATTFKKRWRTLAERLNQAELGGRYFPRRGPTVPKDLFGSEN